jgi:hypothetical protein
MKFSTPINLWRGGFGSKSLGITTPRQVGIEFENHVHQILADNLRVTNLLTEKDIIDRIGPSCTAIDHMFDVPGSSTSICIQTKWKKSKETLDYIHHFIKCVETVQKLTGRNIQGILLSPQPLTSNSTHAFELTNTTNQSVKLTGIHLDPKVKTNLEVQDPIEIQELLVDKLLEFLHMEYQLWSYDPDGSVAMR